MTTQTEDQRQCAKCEQTLPLSAYYPGRYGECRECTRRRYREWYRTHKEQRDISRGARRERIARGEPGSLRYKREAPQ
jgi:hypothetical protein